MAGRRWQSAAGLRLSAADCRRLPTSLAIPRAPFRQSRVSTVYCHTAGEILRGREIRRVGGVSQRGRCAERQRVPVKSRVPSAATQPKVIGRTNQRTAAITPIVRRSRSSVSRRSSSLSRNRSAAPSPGGPEGGSLPDAVPVQVRMNSHELAQERFTRNNGGLCTGKTVAPLIL